MPKKNKEPRELIDLLKDYKFNESIFNDDDEDIYILKRALKMLDKADYLIMMMYTDDSSCKKTANRLGLSPMPVYKEIKKIREKIYKNIEKIKEDDLRRIDFSRNYDKFCDRLD